MQSVQTQLQRQMLAAGGCEWAGALQVPLLWRVAQRLPLVRGLRMRLLAYGGISPERLRD